MKALTVIITCYIGIHNALIHYAQPHGLEQYNGAAWELGMFVKGP